MSKYKQIMLNKGVMQKELLENVRRTDNRVDKSLLSKIVNDVCLPTPKVCNTICDFMGCEVTDIYDVREINLLHSKKEIATQNSDLNEPIKVATARKDRGGLSHGTNIYNLTVEINRNLANRIFSKTALRKLGFLSKTDCIRQYIYYLDRKYKKILEKEKAVKGDQTHLDG